MNDPLDRSRNSITLFKVTGFFLMAIGIVMAMAASQSQNASTGVTGGALLFIGFLAFLIGRFQQ